ncbi:MAG: KaiC protein [Candidatus Thermoplasmatota archaeon]|nr:KaiC protein [Candidatus Thermoplasmatota archaeon]
MTRKTTGIPGLDGMLQGGFPYPSAILVAGEPGTGKTTLAVQSLFHGASEGEKGLYITAISEPQWLVQRFLSSFSFYDQQLVEKGVVNFIDIGPTLTKNPSDILSTIKKQIELYHPARIIIDPITPMTDMLQWRGETREFMHELFAYLKAFECLAIITAELSYDDISHSQESYMVDGVVMLSYPEEEKVRRKFLEVLKMRGTKHTTGRQLIDITDEGLAVQAGLR